MLTFNAYVFSSLFGTILDRGQGALASKVAVVTDGKANPLVLARGTGRPPTSTHTAAVNAIQQTAELKGASALRNAYLYTTEAPTEMCLGMARRAMMKAILSCHGGTVRYYATDLDTHPGSGSVQNVTVTRDGWYGPQVKIRNNWVHVTDWLDPSVAAGSRAILLRDFFREEVSNNVDVAKAIKGLALRSNLAAKTFTVGGEAASLGFSALGLTQAEKDLIFLGVAHQVVARTWGQREDGDGLRPDDSYLGWNIGAVLVDKSGDNIVGWGVNTNKVNCTRHGETNLLQYFEASSGLDQLPDGGTFYTTLEPCQMCAGMLASLVKDKGIRVIWGQDDVAIKQSALQRNVLGEGKAGSASRFGVHGWAETLRLRHGQASERLKQEAQKVINDIDRRYGNRRLPDKEFNQRREAKKVVDGIDRFGGVQTTEFLRQIEAEIFFGQAEHRRKLIAVNRQITDLRETIEGFGGTFKPSSVKGAQEVNLLLGGDILVDLAPLGAAFEKLQTFADSVATLMTRT